MSFRELAMETWPFFSSIALLRDNASDSRGTLSATTTNRKRNNQQSEHCNEYRAESAESDQIDHQKKKAMTKQQQIPESYKNMTIDKAFEIKL